MATATVEERIAALETRLDSLQQLLNERLPQPNAKEKRGWQAIVGTFANDPLYDEAMHLGREWRESQCDEPVEDAS